MAETHNMALSIRTRHYKSTGIPLVNEACVQLDPKKKTIKALESSNGYVGVFRDGQPVLPKKITSALGVEYTINHGDILVMIASWENELEMEERMLASIAAKSSDPVDMGEQYLLALRNPEKISFIFGQILEERESAAVFIRLKAHPTSYTSTDSFESPATFNSAKPRRQRSVVLGWSESDEFDATFVPKESDEDVNTSSETCLQSIINDFQSNESDRKRPNNRNCIIQ